MTEGGRSCDGTYMLARCAVLDEGGGGGDDSPGTCHAPCWVLGTLVSMRNMPCPQGFMGIQQG